MNDLSKVTVGEKVLEWSPGRNTSARLSKVVRVTKTQITTEKGGRYLIRTGYKVGHRWGGGSRIEAATPEAISNANRFNKELLLKARAFHVTNALLSTNILHNYSGATVSEQTIERFEAFILRECLFSVFGDPDPGY